MVLKVNTNSSEGTFNIPFFEGDQEDRGFFIGFNIREKQAHYEGPTNFVIEVKNVSKDNPKLLTIILTGFRQLILNPLSSNGHKPMLVIDKDSFLKAYDSGETGWKEAIDANIEDLKKLGGGVHLIQGLNSMTKATQDAVIKYIRENTAEPPASHYNGTPDEEENDNNELYH
jgi:hypothetical protein